MIENMMDNFPCSSYLHWIKFESLFSNFGHEPRNLKIGLVNNEMNLFGNLNTNNISCLVLLLIYNPSMWFCINPKYTMLSMIILGPRKLGNEIDVYLSALIEDLRFLCEKDVDVDVVCSGEFFKMCAILFYIINYVPAYSNLFRYNCKGHNMCLI